MYLRPASRNGVPCDARQPHARRTTVRRWLNAVRVPSVDRRWVDHFCQTGGRVSRTRPAARRWARVAALVGTTAALALLGGTVVPPASATTVTPKAAMIRPHFGAA